MRVFVGFRESWLVAVFGQFCVVRECEWSVFENGIFG